jgi:hypothetical protein
MRRISVLMIRRLVSANLFRSENMFCTYEVCYPTNPAVMAVIFINRFMNSGGTVYFNSDLRYLLLFFRWFLLIVNYGTSKRYGCCCQKCPCTSDGYNRAAKQFSVPKGTPERYVKDNTGGTS